MLSLASKDEQHAQQFQQTSDLLLQLKTNIQNILEAVSTNASYFTRLSKAWSKTPDYQRILFGILLVMPALILGLVLQINLLISLSLFNLFAFSFSSLMLENHFLYVSSLDSALQQEVQQQATLQADLIKTMSTIGTGINAAVQQYKQSNIKINAVNEKLQADISLLEQTTITEKAAEDELSSMSKQLEQSNIQNSEQKQQRDVQLQLIRTELLRIEQSVNEIQRQSEIKQQQIQQVTIKLSKQLDEANQLVQQHQSYVESLAERAITEEGIRSQFIGKLSAFVGDKDKGFAEVAQTICTIKDELVAAKAALDLSHRCHADLVERFKKLQSQQLQNTQRLEMQFGVAQQLNLLGLYGLSPQSVSAKLQIAAGENPLTNNEVNL